MGQEESLSWPRRLAPYARADNGRALFQLLNTLIPFIVLWWLMLRSLEVGYWLTLALGVPAAFLLVRLFILQHDCGHGSFFSSRRANDLVGTLLGVISLTPYRYWQKTHAIHHASSGNLDRRGLGDIDTLTVSEYLELSAWGRLRYRLYRHPLVLLGVGPIYQFLVKHRFPLDAKWSWKREWRSVLVTNLGVIVVVVVMWRTVGIVPFLMVQLPITLIAGPIGIWLFYVQHQFQDTYWERRREWSFHDAALEGSSWFDLPPVLHWLTGNIGIHHVHHLSSHIPNYHLQRALREVPELQSSRRLTLRTSLACLKLKLWDESSRQLVGFEAVDSHS